MEPSVPYTFGRLLYIPNEEIITVELIYNSLQLSQPMSYLSKQLVFLDGVSLFSRSCVSSYEEGIRVKRKTRELAPNHY